MSNTTGDNPTVHCSFCGKDQTQVRRLIGGPPGRALICEQCINLCQDIIDEEEMDTGWSEDV